MFGVSWCSSRSLDVDVGLTNAEESVHRCYQRTFNDPSSDLERYSAPKNSFAGCSVVHTAIDSFLPW